VPAGQPWPVSFPDPANNPGQAIPLLK